MSSNRKEDGLFAQIVIQIVFWSPFWLAAIGLWWQARWP
jgi:hypothetical protein